jgi:hypothetical protein
MEPQTGVDRRGSRGQTVPMKSWHPIHSAHQFAADSEGAGPWMIVRHSDCVGGELIPHRQPAARIIYVTARAGSVLLMGNGLKGVGVEAVHPGSVVPMVF